MRSWVFVNKFLVSFLEIRGGFEERDGYKWFEMIFLLFSKIEV